MPINYIRSIEKAFEKEANSQIAYEQSRYMKFHFSFLGLKTPKRKEVSKAFLHKDALPSKNLLTVYVKTLWDKPQREYQYFALALLYKFVAQFEEEDIALLEYLITHKSWWDTIDSISPTLVGAYFKKFPHKREEIIEKWLNSNHLWLQRSCILFQLKYKETLDVEYLRYIILHLNETKQFFINKAIGWILREYGKTNPAWVINFCENNTLSNLSKKEALRIILK